MWGGDVFPADKDPTGGKADRMLLGKNLSDICVDPETWTLTELRRWLEAVSTYQVVQPRILLKPSQRNLKPDSKATREELVQRVKANLRPVTKT